MCQGHKGIFTSARLKHEFIFISDFLFCLKNQMSANIMHPYDCRKFVQCTKNFYMYEQDCPTSLILDTKTGECVKESDITGCDMTIVEINKEEVLKGE